jgi:hypothetical protein
MLSECRSEAMYSDSRAAQIMVAMRRTVQPSGDDQVKFDRHVGRLIFEHLANELRPQADRATFYIRRPVERRKRVKELL